MSNKCDFNKVLKTECILQHFTRNCRINGSDDFERAETESYLWKAGLLNLKEKGMIICYIINKCLVMLLRAGK